MTDAYKLYELREEGRQRTKYIEDLYRERKDRLPSELVNLFEEMLASSRRCDTLLDALIDMDMASPEAHRAANERYVAERDHAQSILRKLEAYKP